jgi:hypothetical protein
MTLILPWQMLRHCPAWFDAGIAFLITIPFNGRGT